MEFKSSEKLRAYQRDFYQKNKDQLLPLKRERRLKYYAENKEKVLTKATEYYQKNKEICNMKSLINYYRKKGDTDKVATLEQELIGLLEVGSPPA